MSTPANPSDQPIPERRIVDDPTLNPDRSLGEEHPVTEPVADPLSAPEHPVTEPVIDPADRPLGEPERPLLNDPLVDDVRRDYDRDVLVDRDRDVLDRDVRDYDRDIIADPVVTDRVGDQPDVAANAIIEDVEPGAGVIVGNPSVAEPIILEETTEEREHILAEEAHAEAYRPAQPLDPDAEPQHLVVPAPGQTTAAPGTIPAGDTAATEDPFVNPAQNLDPSGKVMVDPAQNLDPSGKVMVDPAQNLDPSGKVMVDPAQNLDPSGQVMVDPAQNVDPSRDPMLDGAPVAEPRDPGDPPIPAEGDAQIGVVPAPGVSEPVIVEEERHDRDL